MKRVILSLLSILTIFVIYIDLTKGTLPDHYVVQKQAIETVISVEDKIPSFESEVEPGETLISIVEDHINKSLPVSIDELIKDFQALNPGQAPEKIQIGSSYQFPDYSK